MGTMKKDKLLYLFLCLQPFIDLITSLMARFLNTPFTVGVITRGLFLVILLLYTIFNTKTKYRKKTFMYFGLIMIFVVLYFVSKPDIFSLSYLKTEIIYLFKYFYFPIVSVCLLNCFYQLKLDKKKINYIFGINAFVFSILIIIPFITSTGFSSYLGTNKGSIGWFFSANEIGAILTILFPYLYYFLQNMKYKRFLIFSIALIFAMMIIGTKTAFLGMIITEIIFFIYYFVIHERGKKLWISLGILVFSLILIPALPAVSNLQSSIEQNTNKLEEETIEHVDVPTTPFIDRTLNILLSGRQNFLYDTLDIYSNQEIKDRIFGIGFVNRNSIQDKKIEKLIEIDPLDIFFHYGFIGFIIYFIPLIYIFIKSLYHIFKKKFHMSFYQLLYLYSIALLFLISSIAGHVLNAPSVSIYLAFTLVMLYYEVNIIPKENLKEDEITIMALHLGYGGTEQYLSSLCKMLDSHYKINIIATYKVLDTPAFYFDKKIHITYLIDEKPNREEFKSAMKSRDILNIFKEGIHSVKLLYLKKFKNIKAIKNIDSKYIITTRSFHNKLVGMYANDSIVKIATEHNYHNNDKKYIHNTIKSLKNFDYFVCVSKNLQDFYSGKIKNTKCIFIPNVIDSLPNKFSELKNNCLIHVGRFEKEKAQLDLIDVLSKVKEKIPDIKLYLIGDGSYLEKIKERVKELSLEDNVIFTGFISKKEMEKYYLDSKLFVMTSMTESFGLVLIEAMSYKVPCIAFDSADGARELLKDNNGILIKDRDKDIMSCEIIKLLKNKKELERYSENGYRSCQKYLIDNVENDWLNILK